MADAQGAVGFELPTVSVSWTKRDLLLYSISIGVRHDELQYLHELHPEFQAFPTYPIVLSFKEADTDVVDFYKRENSQPEIPGAPSLDPSRFVDGERYISVIKPIPTASQNASFELQTTCLGVHDKGRPGTVKRLEHRLVEKTTGEIYTKIRVSTFAIGQGEWGGPRGPKPQIYTPPQRAPDAVYRQTTTKEQALLYRLNGDYNPLHADPSIGVKMGYNGVILHGLCTWNMAAYAVLRTLCGSDGARLRSFGARFVSAVIPGDTLLTEMWRTGCSHQAEDTKMCEILFLTRKEAGGGVVLGNGRALVTVLSDERDVAMSRL